MPNTTKLSKQTHRFGVWKVLRILAFVPEMTRFNGGGSFGLPWASVTPYRSNWVPSTSGLEPQYSAEPFLLKVAGQCSSLRVPMPCGFSTVPTICNGANVAHRRHEFVAVIQVEPSLREPVFGNAKSFHADDDT